MTDIRQHEPLWGSWHIDALIGEGSFGKVYQVHKEEFGKSHFSAVKVISIPHSEAEVRQAREEGLDGASLRGYFHTQVSDILQEIDMMSGLRGNSNVVSLEDYKVTEKTGEIGWDILIRMELLTSLRDYMADKLFARDDVIRLGIDMCRALEFCSKRNVIHRDIKPENIFVSEFGDYKLGDFGIARQLERTTGGLSKKGTYNYMAPEVFAGAEYGSTVDIYSLGIVMYRFLNRGRTPFLPDYPRPITPGDRENALRRRMQGEALPPIEGLDPALNKIVLKACAYKSKDRFATAAEMRKALEALGTDVDGGRRRAPVAPLKSAEVSETVYDKGSTVGLLDGVSDRVFGGATDGVYTERPKDQNHERDNGKKRTRNYLPLVIVLSVLLVSLLAIGGLWVGGVIEPFAAHTPEPAGVSALSILSAQTDTPTPAAKVGDRLTFGSYQGEAIEWRVLAVENGRALVISDKILDAKPYNTKYVSVTWEASTLRSWLNNDFYSAAFTAAEREQIAETLVVNHNNPSYGTADRIFLLSIEEVRSYFTNNEDRIAMRTYASGVGWWWLLSPGTYSSYAANVDGNGHVNGNGHSVNAGIGGVRPALWLLNP